MATSMTTMFVEQSHHLNMPPSSVWLHVNGISLATDIHHYPPPAHILDARTKHLQSPSLPPPTPPLSNIPAPPASVPYHITVIDGPFQHQRRQQQKLETLEMSKKLFIDRHIKKAKSLPGLIKGTALSRHTPLHSVSFLLPNPPNPSAINSRDDLGLSIDPIDDSRPLHHPPNTSNEPRRPRVYFADFNNIQFIDDKKETAQAKLANTSIFRRQRVRPSRKNPINYNNETSYVSTPTVQPSQSSENNSRSHSRQQYFPPGQDILIKKQTLSISSRGQTFQANHLPDILNSSIQRETIFSDTSPSKSNIQRDKTSNRLRRVAIDLPENITLDVTRDHKRSSRAHSSSVRESTTQQSTTAPEVLDIEPGTSVPRRSSLVSTSTIHRQRALLRQVSLRQQNPLPFKSDMSHHGSQQSHYTAASSNNVRRSASLKYTHARPQENHDDLPIDETLTIHSRSIVRTESARPIKRSHVIHFGSKNSIHNETAETHRYPNRSHTRKSSQERFQNMLTIVRPPYIGGSVVPTSEINTPSIQSNVQTPNGSHRTTRRTSAQGPLEFHITSNTIVV